MQLQPRTVNTIEYLYTNADHYSISSLTFHNTSVICVIFNGNFFLKNSTIITASSNWYAIKHFSKLFGKCNHHFYLQANALETGLIVCNLRFQLVPQLCPSKTVVSVNTELTELQFRSANLAQIRFLYSCLPVLPPTSPSYSFPIFPAITL